MTKQDKENILIAEFMGLKDYSVEELRYDCDWNWIITVVRKIFNTKIDYSKYVVLDVLMTSINYELTKGSIEIVYDKIVNFIKSYNKLKEMEPSLKKLSIKDKTLKAIVVMYNEEFPSEKVHVKKAIDFYVSITDKPKEDEALLYLTKLNENLLDVYDEWN